MQFAYHLDHLTQYLSSIYHTWLRIYVKLIHLNYFTKSPWQNHHDNDTTHLDNILFYYSNTNLYIGGYDLIKGVLKLRFYSICLKIILSKLLNSLWPRDAIWRQRSMSTLAHVMACCLTAPSHYMNQCWLIISQVLWYSPKSYFVGIDQDINLGNKLENYAFKIIFPSAWGK